MAISDLQRLLELERRAQKSKEDEFPKSYPLALFSLREMVDRLLSRATDLLVNVSFEPDEFARMKKYLDTLFADIEDLPGIVYSQVLASQQERERQGGAYSYYIMGKYPKNIFCVICDVSLERIMLRVSPVSLDSESSLLGI